MKSVSLLWLAVVALVFAGHAQAQIYRCGNEYTNTVSEEQKSQCKLLEGGNVTVVQGFKPPVAAVASRPSSPVRPDSAAPAAGRVDSAEQKERDSDARPILESELRKAEARHAELMREYNNGEPEKRGIEARNYQKYLDRVEELKADLARSDSDMVGIRRELGRIPGGK